MAVDFLEPIYKKALLITDFEESLSCLFKKDFGGAKKIYNSAISQVEELLPELASADENLAQKLSSCCEDIAETWANPAVASGIIQKSLFPLLYEYMSYFSGIDVEEGNYRLQSSDSGFLTITDTVNNVTFHDTHNPMSEASILADNIYRPTNREIHILGCGLGYLPYMLFKKSQGAAKIVIYESDSSAINYAKQFGVLSLIPKHLLQFILIDNPVELAREFMTYINNNEKDIIDRNIAVHINQWKITQYRLLGIDIIEKENSILAFNREKYTGCVINMMKNYSKAHISVNDLLVSPFKEDWIVVAAGPSLDECIPFIKDSKGSKTIVAVNTVIRRLSAEMIVPDLIVAADPRSQLLDHLKGYENYTRNITLIADETTNWQFIEAYKGDICFVPTPNGASLPLSNPENTSIWDVSGTVVTLGIESALRLGAKRIILAGLDLAYPGGISYANGVSQVREENKKGNSKVKSVDGTMIESCQAFDMFRQIIEKQISKHPETEFVNMSRHGALIKGAKPYESC